MLKILNKFTYFFLKALQNSIKTLNLKSIIFLIKLIQHC